MANTSHPFTVGDTYQFQNQFIDSTATVITVYGDWIYVAETQPDGTVVQFWLNANLIMRAG